MSDYNNGWEEWGKHVLATLEKLEHKVSSLEDKINADKLESVTEIITLKTKAGLWGSIAGIITSLVTAIIAGLIIWNLTTGIKQPPTSEPLTKPVISMILPPRDMDEFTTTIINDNDDLGA